MVFTSSRHLSGIFLNGDIFYIKFMSADSNTLQSPGGYRTKKKLEALPWMLGVWYRKVFFVISLRVTRPAYVGHRSDSGSLLFFLFICGCSYFNTAISHLLIYVISQVMNDREA